MTLKYKITFFDYWHLSSGLSAGTKLDSSVVKDQYGLPYVPGKTLKGLLREQAELVNPSLAAQCFGDEKECVGVCYFGNSTIEKSVADEIISNSLQAELYDTITSTKIDDNGVAEDNSLREIEVVIPLELYGEIVDIATPEQEKILNDAIGLIKRVGLNRNRGLGRCKIEVLNQ